MGRALVAGGLVLVCLGLLVMVAGKLNLPLGRLPGDILWRRGNTTVSAPLVTCLLISIALSLFFWLLGRR